MRSTLYAYAFLLAGFFTWSTAHAQYHVESETALVGGVVFSKIQNNTGSEISSNEFEYLYGVTIGIKAWHKKKYYLNVRAGLQQFYTSVSQASTTYDPINGNLIEEATNSIGGNHLYFSLPLQIGYRFGYTLPIEAGLGMNWFSYLGSTLDLNGNKDDRATYPSITKQLIFYTIHTNFVVYSFPLKHDIKLGVEYAFSPQAAIDFDNNDNIKQKWNTLNFTIIFNYKMQ